MFTNDMLTWLPDTPKWVPAECDVPIRKLHWFWHPKDEESLLSLDELLNIYYRSIGRGTNLLLNISPDTRGLLPEFDIERVIEFSDEIKRRFTFPINEISGKTDCLELIMTAPAHIDHAILMEEISEGERVREYVLEAEQDGKWVEVVRGIAIGHKKIHSFESILTYKIRLTILKSEGIPLIKSFSVYST
jgi:alpha-L-fucosidase